MDYEHILYEAHGGVARVTIDRPKKYNAFNSRTLLELTDAYERIRDDRDIGVVVLSGSGDKSFCAGGDIEWEHEGGLEGYAADRENKALYKAMRDCLKPTIARVNGYAIGGGNHLAYFCDFTIAAEHAIFGQNGARVGSPGFGWTVGYSVHIVGSKRAREMWMLCRRYTAQQMYEWGLVNAVVPMTDLDDEVNRWCAELLALSPTVLKILKKGFDDEYAALREFQDTHDYIAEVNPDFFASGEQREGTAAFLEKRPPDFSAWR
jgi:dihydroxynaphthoic acid synthetase